jgi:hypothetical protein
MTRVKRERNAKNNAKDAKNNAKITRDNARFCGSRDESGAAYVLYLRELPRIGSGIWKNNHPVLVNGDNWVGRQSSPGPPSPPHIMCGATHLYN